MGDVPTAPRPKFIFGSSSAFRRAIFDEFCRPQLAAAFDIVVTSADIDEKAIRAPVPSDMVLAIARGKQAEILRRMEGGAEAAARQGVLCYTTDQIAIAPDGTVREKPEGLDEQRAFLRSYSGSFVDTVAACVLWKGGKEYVTIERTRTRFRAYDDAAIDAFLAKGSCQLACGGFAVGDMEPYVERIDGGRHAVEGLTPAVLLDLVATALADSA
jgi:septum formation protein